MCENWQVSTFLVIFNLNMNYFSHNIRFNINQIAQLVKQLIPNVKFRRSNPATCKLEQMSNRCQKTGDNFLYSNLVNSNLVKWNTRIKSYETAQGLLKILSVS